MKKVIFGAAALAVALTIGMLVGVNNVASSAGAEPETGITFTGQSTEASDENGGNAVGTHKKNDAAEVPWGLQTTVSEDGFCVGCLTGAGAGLTASQPSGEPLTKGGGTKKADFAVYRKPDPSGGTGGIGNGTGGTKKADYLPGSDLDDVKPLNL